MKTTIYIILILLTIQACLMTDLNVAQFQRKAKEKFVQTISCHNHRSHVINTNFTNHCSTTILSNKSEKCMISECRQRERFRRSQSTRCAPEVVYERQLTRRRPSTLHVRRSRPTESVTHHPRHSQNFYANLPRVNINEMAPVEIVECPVDHHPHHHDQQESSTQPITQYSLPNNHQLCPNSMLPSSVADRLSRSTSSSPRRAGTMRRRESVLQMLNRIWKSDECTRRPSVQKSAALDVPTEPLSRQLSLSETNVHPISRFSKLNLTPKHKRLLRTTFNSLNSGVTFQKLMEKIFRRLEVKCPDIRSIFLTTAFVNSLSRERSSPPMVKTENDHCKCLVGIFERLIDNLDTIHEQLAIIRTYGEKHAQMGESGFTGTMIEQFGEIAVSVIGAQDVVKFNHEAVKAWRLLIACVTDEMKVGFDRIIRIRDRRSSCNQAI